MPTPPKPFTVLTLEKKSHRTKSELKQRKKGEEALATGVAMRERPSVRSNPIAHKEFRRLNTILGSIKKNDAIYEVVINRYCNLLGEEGELESKIRSNDKDLKQLEEAYNNREIDYLIYLDKKDRTKALYLTYDKKIMEKRRMMFDVEKENIMTIAAALRSIPKKEEKASNPLLEALRNA